MGAFILLQTHYNYSTHVVRQAVDCGSRILGCMPVCTVLDSGASIQACHPVDSLAVPQTMATSSIAGVLHATSAQHGYVKGGYSHTARHMEGTSSTDRLMPYTRHHALLFGKYSMYAVILNCFSNSLQCLWA